MAMAPFIFQPIAGIEAQGLLVGTGMALAEGMSIVPSPSKPTASAPEIIWGDSAVRITTPSRSVNWGSVPGAPEPTLR